MSTRDDHAASRQPTGAILNDLYQLYLRVMRRVGHYRWFALFMKHAGSQADRALIRASRGRLSLSGPQMPTMLLTTTGRRTGKERTVPLYFVPDGNNLVAVCENFGLDTASSWPKNLLANPNARIEINGVTANYLSREATEQETWRALCSPDCGPNRVRLERMNGIGEEISEVLTGVSGGNGPTGGGRAEVHRRGRARTRAQ